ncbi:hypothetical protein G7Z17_g11649 [Cylindrodendrum hubeiense]|uniref:Uncharacterized protein n=1 Tax=Cylindrodendrum hubeiense TaxID=595255 RepID=A0A9P5H0K8_9HYPO|nr:hypothetical protein G7Z17_g11649 [Cylindrodendrum hubeiense]
MSSNQPHGGENHPLNDPMIGVSEPDNAESNHSDQFGSFSDESGQSSSNEWIQHDPFLSDVRRIQWPKTLVPPKNAKEGSWNHVRYAPVWTDPDWQEEGPKRETFDYPISDGIMSRVRPALLAKDQIQNPTEYAKRFGIFPGRVDGRSRTSPTRAESRKLFPSGDVRSGKDLFNRLEKLAADKGRSLEDFMAEERIDMQKMSERDEACMRVYEDLLVDEHWQGIIFGDLTMDELHAEDYFTMGNAESKLEGPLHSLSLVPYTTSMANEENMIHGVWDAMQPALQLASRLLGANDPFLSAIKDVTNRFRVDDNIDPRPKEEKEKLPRFTFRRFVDMNDPRLVPAAREMRQYPNFDASAMSKSALEKCVQLSIRSGHYHFGTDFMDLAPSGLTMSQALEAPDEPIKISISAELVWPLLEPNLSTSEKMMASFVLATTIVHELMHAWTSAHYKWLYNPAAFGISAPKLQEICNQLREELYPEGKWSLCLEPSFENDPVSEVGHAYEQHVLGGGSWSLASNMNQRAGPTFLGDYSGMAVHVKWPDGTPGSLDILSRPKYRTEQYSHFLRIGDIQKYFTEEFWQNSVKRYGMAAMRDPSKKPHKVFFAPESCQNSDSILCETGLEPKYVRDWMNDYLNELHDEGKHTLDTYLRMLISESCSFGLMTKRLIKDRQMRASTEWPWLKSAKFNIMLLTELRGHLIMLSSKPEDQKLAGIENEYLRWMKLAKSAGAWPDENSQRCHDSLDAFRHVVSHISTSNHNDRIIPNLMDMVNYLESEREYQESMLCELYRLPSEIWIHYKHGFEKHYEFCKIHANLILKALSSIVTLANDIDTWMPSWSGEWRARIQSLATAFTNIKRLLELDSADVCEGWRDLLATVPMLRKCRRQPHQQWFFLAKKEMLSLTGEDLENLREFKRQLEVVINLELYKIVLPEADVDEQGLMQRWAGLLDDVMEKKASGPNLAGVFSTEPVQNLVEKLKEKEREAEKQKCDRAAERAAENTRKAKQKNPSPTLQQMAESQAHQPPQMPPQITRPLIQGHAISLGGFQATQFGQTSQISGSPTASSFGTSSHAFGPYSSSSNLFPSRKEGEASPWAAQPSTGQAAQANEPDKNKSRQAQPIGSIMPHPFAIRTTVTKDLLNVVASKIDALAVDTFAQEGPREGGSILGNSGPQGEGELGNMDDVWEQQYQEMEGVEYNEASQGSDEEGLDLLEQWVREEEARERQERAAAGDGDVDMAHGNSPPGAAFLAKMKWDDDDSALASSVASTPATRESSYTSVVDSNSLSRLETEVDSGLDIEDANIARGKTALRLKRKGIWTAANETKRVKTDTKEEDGTNTW